LKSSLPTASLPGRWQRGGFHIFLENSVPSAPGTGRRQRLFFYFCKQTLCRELGAKAVGKDCFLFFKKLSLPSAMCNYARQSWEHPSWENFSKSCRA
jgi:hypothetical protein